MTVVIGLVGGIASGKSLVAEELGRLGAVVLDADRAAHAALAEPAIAGQLVARWGDEIVDAGGVVDRSAIAARVFRQSPEGRADLEFLEGLLHPKIRADFVRSLDGHRREGAAAVVIDAPLLLEAGWGSLCDEIVFVDSAREDRLLRALARGWTEADFDGREASQLPITEKKQAATCVLPNRGGTDALRQETARFWAERIAPGA
ncbi:MAG: dephospho-CoA kinase [Planctomycetota bacterium]